jgi:hypothetical protein
LNNLFKSPILLIFLALLISGLMISGINAQESVAKKPVSTKVPTRAKVSGKDIPEVPLTNARIKFDHAEYNFGNVPPKTKVTHEFPVTNDGVDTLVITKVKAGCGCTTSKAGGTVIPPGATSYVDLTYRSSSTTRYVGVQTKKAKIYSNDSSNPTAEIAIKASINNPDVKLSLDPAIADMGDIKVGDRGKITVNLTNTDSLNAELVVVCEPSDKVVKKYKLHDTKLKPGETTTIDFETQKDLSPGDFLATITIEDKNNANSKISIPITGKIVEQIKADSETPKTVGAK